MFRAARALSRSRQLIPSPTPPSPLFSTCVVGSSKDLDIPFHSSFSTSATVTNNIRTKPSKAARNEKLAKLERKRSQRAMRAEKEENREAEARIRLIRKDAEVKEKIAVGKQVAEALPPLTEEQLESMYRGLIAAEPQELALGNISAPTTELLPDPSATPHSRLDCLTRLASRLNQLEDGRSITRGEEDDEVQGDYTNSEEDSRRLSEVLKSRRNLERPVAEVEGVASAVAETDSEARRLLRRLQGILPTREEVAESVEGFSSSVARGVVVKAEWRDLVLTLADEEDTEGVETALKLMQRFTPTSDIETLSQVMALYAERGRSRDALKLAHFASETGIVLSIAAHHHLLSALLPTQPTLAIQHLHSLEAADLTPLMETYTLVIRRLLSPSSPPHLISRGWDLYAHSRLVSHPTPSVDLFSTMISACAHGQTPAPERAMDLFTEMTEDNGLPASQEAYNGLIRAYARQGSQENYFEALRFMRRMLDDNVRPTRSTLHAVLEGSRRHGDLARARWILVKMVEVGGEDIAPNADTLALVFQSYAAYKPPIRQGGRVTKEKTVAVASVHLKEVDATIAKADPENDTDVSPEEASLPFASSSPPFSEEDTLLQLLGESSLVYPGPLPETTDELLNEAHNLMAQCVDPSILRPSTTSSSSPDLPRMFPAVDAAASVFLLNSYLTLLTRHGPFDDAVRFFDDVFDKLGTKKNSHSFEIMSSRCQMAKNRDFGTEVGKRVFAEWRDWLKGEQENETKESGRSASFMWASTIRILARNFNDLEALSLLKTFIATYPPSALPAAARASREASRSVPAQPSLVRLSSPLYPETTPTPSTDLRPPFLRFEDIKLLHMRLANVEDKEGMATVKGICKAYEGALREAKDIEERRPNWRSAGRREREEGEVDA